MRSLLLLRRVEGNSMLPTLQPGQLVLASGLLAVYEEGDVIILRHGGLEKIKRITGKKNGRYFVAGDNTAESTDSHEFGWIDNKAIIGKLVWPRLSA